MKSKIIIIIVFSAISVLSLAQPVTQTIRGRITDEFTGEELPGANIYMPEIKIGTTSDYNGKFLFDSISVGRHLVSISFIGYETYNISNLYVSSGKEVFLDVKLRPAFCQLKEVEIKAVNEKDKPFNSMATVSARTISVDEASRYAGSFDDPGRMASNFAGVTNAGVAVNAIVVRGNAPKGVLWRVEGIDVPVPSHFAGSNVAGGGGITMFSSRLLANSDFYTGAFPAEYANASAAVFDMKLRNGNSNKHEFGFQFGIHGVEAAAEGPFKKGYDGSFLFNYRYSSLALIFPLLPEMKNSDEVPVYQDLSFKVNLPAGKAGNFSIWGIGGLGTSKMRGTNDTLDWIYPESRVKMDFYYNMGVTGISHSKTIKSKTLLSSGLALSASGTGYDKSARLTSLQPELLTGLFDVKSENKKISYYTRLNHVVSSKFILRGGVNLNAERFNLYGKALNYTTGNMEQSMNGVGNSVLLNAHLQTKFYFSRLFYLTAGVNISWFNLENKIKAEPRLSASYQVSTNQLISFGYGLHHQTEPLFVYYVSKPNNNEDILEYPNKNLNRTAAHHFVISYDNKLSSNLRLKIEPYLQLLYGVPVVQGSSYSMVNFMSDWTFNKELVNDGEATNFGIDFTFERFLSKGFYYLSTLSLYKSEYIGGDGKKYRSRFDGGYVLNILGGKEFTVNEKNVLSLNLKLTLMGPYLHQQVDNELSELAQNVIYDYNSEFSYQNSPIEFMSDLTVSYKINSKRTASIFTVQLKNFVGNQYQGKKYNLQTGKIEDEFFTSIIPFVSYKLEF